jgi:hypothetical protein
VAGDSNGDNDVSDRLAGDFSSPPLSDERVEEWAAGAAFF